MILDVNAGWPLAALRHVGEVEGLQDRPFVVAALGLARTPAPRSGRGGAADDRSRTSTSSPESLTEAVTMYQPHLLSSTEASSLMELGLLGKATEVVARRLPRRRGRARHSGPGVQRVRRGCASARGRVTTALRWSREAAGPLSGNLNHLVVAAGGLWPAPCSPQRCAATSTPLPALGDLRRTAARRGRARHRHRRARGWTSVAGRPAPRERCTRRQTAVTNAG